jgi:uncharacterized membrane protein
MNPARAIWQNVRRPDLPCMPTRPRIINVLVQRPRLGVAACVGIVAGFFIPNATGPIMRSLIGWNSALWLYLALVLQMMVRATPDDVRALAAPEDENAAAVLSVVSAAALASTAAIVTMLATAGKLSEAQRIWHVTLAGATVVGSWAVIPVVFTLHYARVYYRSPPDARALIFPDRDLEPDYWDFLYFSFTIAVASQTSDIALASRAARRIALAQSLLAFFFNASILAMAINIAASVVSQ